MRAAEGLGAVRPSVGRLATFTAICMAAAVILEDPLTVAGARPDFVLIAIVYGATRGGALRGAALGFGLGLFRDSLIVTHFGLHALGGTILGYALGKLRETLYITTPGVDLLLLAAAKILIDVLVLGVAAGGAWAAFEVRFFWEGPVAAAYTGALGALLYRFLLER